VPNNRFVGTSREGKGEPAIHCPCCSTELNVDRNRLGPRHRLPCPVCANWLLVLRCRTGFKVERAKLTAADIAYIDARMGRGPGAA